MDPGTIGLIGGLAGSAIGIAGGIYGTRRSLRMTKTPAERKFVARLAAWIWIALIAFIAIPLALAMFDVIPMWGYWIAFAAFFAVMGPVAARANRRQMELRNTE